MGYEYFFKVTILDKSSYGIKIIEIASVFEQSSLQHAHGIMENGLGAILLVLGTRGNG